MEGWWWVGFCVCVYVCACTGEWMSKWVSEWVGGWVSEWAVWVRWVSEGEWVSGWVSGWVGEWVGEWVSEWVWVRWVSVSEEECVCVCACVCVSEWVRVWRWLGVSEWLSDWVSDVSAWVGMSDFSEWVSDSKEVKVNEWVWMSVSTVSHTCHSKATSNAHCLTPATQKRRSPKGRQGVHLTPWQCTLSHACHAKAAEPQGTPGRTSDPLAVHVDVRLPRKRSWAPRDARAYIRPLGSAHCPTPATQKRRSPKGRQGVHLTPWQCTLSHACHAKAAEPQGTPGRTSNPLAVHVDVRLPRKSGGAPRDARAYIWPLGSARWCTPATQKRRSPKGRQGVHQTPWQCTLSHACHAKEAEPQGTPGRTSDPLAVHIVPRLPRKRGGAARDARAYIRPLGSADCPTPATQKKLSPKGRQGVHPTPWQCTLSHACHAKAAEPQGTPGRTSDPLAVHIVPRLPRKSGGAPRDARAYIQPLGSAHCPTPATQKRRSPKGRQGVHPTPWQCTLSHACHAKCTLAHACHASEWVSVCEWVSECEWEWEWEWEWECECECEWEWEWEWECEWVSERVSVCVCGWGGGRAGEAADTELKTKTPHVNVGKNHWFTMCT